MSRKKDISKWKVKITYDGCVLKTTFEGTVRELDNYTLSCYNNEYENYGKALAVESELIVK